MKKFIIPAALSLLLLTGCGKEETVVCTNNQKSFGVEMNSKLNVVLKSNKFVSMDMTIEAILPENLLSQKETFIKSFEKQYEGFEDKYGVQPVVSETDEGAKIEMKMTAEQAKEFYGSNDTKATRKDVIEEFGKQGFTCE